MAPTLLDGILLHGRDSFLDSHAVEEAGIDHDAGIVLERECTLGDIAALNDLDDRQTELRCKVPVSLIVAWNAHDNARAVTHKNIIGDEHRHDLAGGRIRDLDALKADAGLVLVEFAAFKIGLAGSCLLVSFDVGPVGDALLPLVQQWMLRGNDGIRHTEERVNAGCVNGDIVFGIGLEGHFRAGRAADPVFLLSLDTLNIIQTFEIEIVDQTVGIFRDAQHPLALFLADNRRAAALTHTLNDLFVGKYTLAAGAPVDGHRGLISKAVLVHLQEDPLRPAVIIRVGCVDDALPVETVAEHFELTGEVFDIPLGDDGRMDVVFDGEVFRRQAKCIEADGVQDVIALHALFAADDIHGCKRTRMADMKTGSGGVWELDQAVKLWLFVPSDGGIGLLLLPFFLPFLLNGCKIVFHNKLLCLIISFIKNAPDHTVRGVKIRGTTLIRLFF